MLVDGFEAARLMLRRNNLNTSILSKVYFHAHSGCDKDAIVQPAIPFPVLNLHPATGTLYQVRWDNASRAPRCDFNGLSLSTWYVAAKKFADIIENEAMGRSFQLEPGTPISKSAPRVPSPSRAPLPLSLQLHSRNRNWLTSCYFLVFDNWRMLHGSRQSVGRQRICGGYCKCEILSLPCPLLIWTLSLVPPCSSSWGAMSCRFESVTDDILALVRNDDFASRLAALRDGRAKIIRDL